MTTVLFAEDDPDLLELGKVWLVGQGYEVIATGTGFTAVQLMAECKPDLLLLDARLPDLKGDAVIEYIRAFSNAPILVVTGAESAAARALEVGANDYLMKPYDPLDLLDRVKALLATRAGVEGAAGLPAPRSADQDSAG